MDHPDSIALISMTTTLPSNTMLSENFKVNFSLADSFKKFIKRDAGLLLLLRKENIGTLGAGTLSPLLECRT